MIAVGLPGHDAITYFVPEDTPADALKQMAQLWLRHPLVRQAQAELNGGNWSKLTPEERVKRALAKHYNDLAYFLMSTNYGEADAAKKGKADTCRDTLEKQVAASGPPDIAAQFWKDALEGKGRFAPKSDPKPS